MKKRKKDEPFGYTKKCTCDATTHHPHTCFLMHTTHTHTHAHTLAHTHCHTLTRIDRHRHGCRPDAALAVAVAFGGGCFGAAHHEDAGAPLGRQDPPELSARQQDDARRVVEHGPGDDARLLVEHVVGGLHKGLQGIIV